MSGLIRAFVIDDDKFCSDLLSEFLVDRGCQVVGFPDVTACPLFSKPDSCCDKMFACADFLLLDNQMPFMDGIEFIELIAHGKCLIRTTGMAILSANLSQDSLDRAKSFGCKTFDKPYDFELLSAWLDDQDKSLEKERRLSPLCSAMKKNDNGQTIQPRGD